MTEERTVTEDLLLLLFQPDSATIAGENTLFYVLAGAVLTDLGTQGSIRTDLPQGGVVAVEGKPPADPLLRPAWDYIARKPQSVQAALAAIGTSLREPVLGRLATRGDLVAEKRRFLGARYALGSTGRRDELIDDLKALLGSGEDRGPRTAVLAALVFGSGTLPQFHREIPWTSEVIERAQKLVTANWGAGAASEAVERTMMAVIAHSVAIAVLGTPQS